MEAKKLNEAMKIPEEFPAVGQDWANHIARSLSSDAQIQLVVEFDRQLDFDCLTRAVRLLLDAEPILGCRFIEDQDRPYWKRIADLDTFEWCTLEFALNKAEALNRFLIAPLEPEYHQLWARIIRLERNDIFCLKLNHACCDGGGAKDCLQLLANLYTRLSQNPDYLPGLNCAGKRDANRVFKQLGLSGPKAAWNPELAVSQPAWAFPHYEGCPERAFFTVSQITKQKFTALAAAAKSMQATINDLFLTAFYRGMFALTSPEPELPLEIHVTVDLRRYLPEQKSESICNLSGIAPVKLTRRSGESFDLTLERIVEMTQRLKNGNPGVHSAAAMELLSMMRYQDAVAVLKKAQQQTKNSRKCAPLLSNLGVLAPYPLTFGELVVENAYWIPSAFFAPGFMLGVSTYHDTLTLAVSCFEPEIRREDVERLLTLIETELAVWLDSKSANVQN